MIKSKFTIIVIRCNGGIKFTFTNVTFQTKSENGNAYLQKKKHMKISCSADWYILAEVLGPKKS